MSLLRPSGALLSVGATLFFTAAHARADTLPDLTAACFTYTPGQVTGSGHKISATGFHAELPGTSYSVSVGNVALSDESGKLNTAALTRLNAAAAYAVMISYNHGLPAACQNQPLPETEALKSTQPDLTWTGVTLRKEGHDLSVQHAHLRMLSTTPQAHLRFEATGLHEPNHPMVPQSASGDISFTPKPMPPYDITLENLKAALGTSQFSGYGTLHAGSTLPQSSGQLHIAITQIGPLIERVSRVVPAKITMALTLARLMGHSDDAQTTSWDVTMTHGKIKINGVKIPLPLEQ